MPPIACGPTSVTKAYCGATEISKGYCGSNLFFSSFVNMPIPIRSAVTSVNNDSGGLIFGGWPINNDTYSFSVANNLVRSELLTPVNPPAARYDAAMAGSVTNGVMFGGVTTSAQADFYTYSVANGIITWVRPTHTSTTARSGHRIVGTRASGLIFFGNSGSNELGNVLRYVRQSNGNYTFSSLPSYGNVYSYQRRRSHFGIAGDTSAGIIFGGRRSGNLLNDFIRYTATSSRITWARPSLSGVRPAVRRQMGVAGTATQGVIFGGRSSSSARYNDAYSYSVSGNTVTVRRLTASGTISARGSFAMMGTSATAGFVWGGSGRPAPNNLFVRYAVSGSTITWTTLQYAT